MMDWLRKRRLRNLRQQLAVVQATIDADAEFTRLTGTVFPMAMVRSAQEMARIKFQIGELEQQK